MADTETNPAILTLTEAAQAAAKKLLAEEGDPTGKALRVGVNSGGCSGFSYAISIDVKKEDDTVVPYDDFEVVVDSVSQQFLNGIRIDYVDTIGHAGFTFDNPQATSSCGCGTSFDVS